MSGHLASTTKYSCPVHWPFQTLNLNKYGSNIGRWCCEIRLHVKVVCAWNGVEATSVCGNNGRKRHAWLFWRTRQQKRMGPFKWPRPQAQHTYLFYTTATQPEVKICRINPTKLFPRILFDHVCFPESLFAFKINFPTQISSTNHHVTTCNTRDMSNVALKHYSFVMRSSWA